MSEQNITELLHPAFLARMKEMLGEEYDSFIKSYEVPRTYGLRVNTAKISCEEFEKLVPFPVTPIPWIPNGYFYPEDVRPSYCPFYQAGLYYLQEPSAMTPASCLPVTPGENVLDLCAAPGGKTTELGARLNGEGLLVANDISASRTRALLRNVELFGFTNAFVANETPARLRDRFPEFFHKILLDAPCSGEGMFRKEEALARDWTPEKSQELATIQRELILQAADMLRPGGQLLYSTCTFAPDEDEGVVSWLLENRPDMELIELPSYEGFTPGVPEWGNGDPRLTRCVHLFPHTMQGEGHFMALFRKEGRTDLIGFDKKCLIRPRQIKGRDFAAGGYKGAHHGSQTAKPAAANRAKDAKRPAVGGMTGHKQTGVNGNGRNAEGFGGAVGGKSSGSGKKKTIRNVHKKK